MRSCALDLETYLITPQDQAPKIVCGQMGTCEDGRRRVYLRDELRPQLDKILDGTWEVWGHNISFDLACLIKTWPDLTERIWTLLLDGKILDTMIAAKLRANEDGTLQRLDKPGVRAFSMMGCVEREFGADLSADKSEDSWRLRYSELDGVPVDQWPEDALRYALDDVYWTHRLALRYGHPADLKNKTCAQFALYLTTVEGIHVDADVVERLRSEFSASLVGLQAQLVEAKILKWNKAKSSWSKDMKQIKARVIAAWPDGDWPLTKTGLEKRRELTRSGDWWDWSEDQRAEFCEKYASTDGDTCQQSGDNDLITLDEYKGVEKLLTSYLTKLDKGKDHPLRVSYSVPKATGRTSAWGDIGIQQLPRKYDVRCAIIPSSRDRVIVGCDYDSLELRSWAQVCLDLLGQSTLAENYQRDPGFDPHSYFAGQMRGVDYKTALQLKKTDPTFAEDRQLAKCFHPDTEVLTRKGWVRVCDLTMQDEVCAALVHGASGADNIQLDWQKPLYLTTRHADSLIHLKGQDIDLMVTPDHRMPTWTRQDVYSAVNAEDHGKIDRVCAHAGFLSYGNEGDDKIGWYRLAVAVQADGSYSGRCVRFGFTKQRKVERLRALLATLGADYEEGVSSQGAITFTLGRMSSGRVRALLNQDKTLPWTWLDLSLDIRRAIIEEAEYWDSSTIRGGRSFHYTTTIKQNADVLTALAATTGRKCNQMKKYRGNPAHADVYTVAVKDRPTSRTGGVRRSLIAWDKSVYCLTVDADALLVRYNGTTCITHQCPNFGYPGGMGAATLVSYARAGYGVILTTERAQELKEVWFQVWEEARPYLDFISRRVMRNKDRGSIEQIRSGRLRGDVTFCAAANGYFQGLAADGALRAVVEVQRRCYADKSSALYGSKMLAFIHDEILVDTPADRGHDAAMELRDVMISSMQEFTPDIPIRCEPVIMERWIKGAKPVYDNNGRLVACKG